MRPRLKAPYSKITNYFCEKIICCEKMRIRETFFEAFKLTNLKNKNDYLVFKFAIILCYVSINVEICLLLTENKIIKRLGQICFQITNFWDFNVDPLTFVKSLLENVTSLKWIKNAFLPSFSSYIFKVPISWKFKIPSKWLLQT